MRARLPLPLLLLPLLLGGCATRGEGTTGISASPIAEAVEQPLGMVLLEPGVALHPSPGEEGPVQVVGTPRTDEVARAAAARVARVVQRQGPWLQVLTLRSGSCSPGLPLSRVQLLVWVHEDALVPVLSRELRVDTGAGTELLLQPGLPVSTGPDGETRVHLGGGLRVAVELPEGSLSTVLSEPERPGEAGAYRRVQVRGPVTSPDGQLSLELPESSHAGDGDRSFDGWVVETEELGEGRRRVSLQDRCWSGSFEGELEVLGPGGVIGGVLGATESGPSHWVRLPMGTALQWRDGRPAGRILQTWYLEPSMVWRGGQGRRCMAWVAQGAAPRGTEGAFELCWLLSEEG